MMTEILIFDKIWRNWQNSGSVTKFLMKFALFDERKMTFVLAAKSFGA